MKGFLMCLVGVFWFVCGVCNSVMRVCFLFGAMVCVTTQVWVK